MKPRPTLLVRPLFVSQDNSFAILGITPRKFREVVVPMCRDAVVRIGKSALVPTDIAERRLCALASGRGAEDLGPAIEPANDRDDNDDETQTVDEILRALGRQRER